MFSSVYSYISSTFFSFLYENNRSYIPYSQREEWKDIEPVKQDDGDNPIVPIAYTEEFSDVHNYFRAILKKKEFSPRVLSLTKDVINLNPSNYTVWHYRRLCLEALKSDLKEELIFCDDQCQQNQKNYQVWYHRRAILEKYRKVESSELLFIADLLKQEEKNYHVWAYRQWVVKEFQLFEGEYEFCDSMLKLDFRNNSAWNYRFFLVENLTQMSEFDRKKEIDFGFSYINKAPNNESAWNYVKGMTWYKVKNIKLEQHAEVDDGKINKGKDGLNVSLCQYLKEKTENLLEKASVNIFGHSTLLFCCETLLSTFWGSSPSDGKQQSKIEEATTANNDNAIVLFKVAIDTCQKLQDLDEIRKKYWSFKKTELEKKYSNNNK